MAGTAATVLPVKRAVHHLTAPRHAPKPIRRSDAPAKPAVVAQQQVRCAPLGGIVPAVPLVTYAEPVPDEPGGFFGPGGGLPIPGGVGIIGGGGGGGGGTTPVTPPVPGGPDAGPVPEPSVWLMLISGVGLLGMTLRGRRGGNRDAGTPRAGAGRRSARRATAGGLLWSGSAAVEAGDMAATVALKSAVASAAGKAMLCVCPAVVVAGSVMTVPPLRQAVYAATTPPQRVPSLAALPAPVTLPCIEETVPVATAAVDGFPATVATAVVPVQAAAAAPAAAPASPAPARMPANATAVTGAPPPAG